MMADNTVSVERRDGRIEGYAMALGDIMLALTGDSHSAKSYDPMTVSDGVMMSYAFNLKDGTRRHPIADYNSLGEIFRLMLTETLEALGESNIPTFRAPIPKSEAGDETIRWR